MDELASEFVSEAAEALGGLQAGVARLAADPNDHAAAIDTLRRLHGLKGLCGFFGLARGEVLIHAGESLVEAAASAHATPAALAALSALIERLAQLIADSEGAFAEPEGDDALLLAELATAAALIGEPSSAPRAHATTPVRLSAPSWSDDERRGRAPWIGLDTLAQALGDRLGKRIGLVVGGDDLRIAPAAARPLRLALIALVRNACDHGIEDPSARRAAGKAALSLLRLSVHRHGEGAIIELADDGRGIDPDRIRAHCIATGRIAPKAAARLDAEASQALVFTAGVTTAAEAGPISGRGLGLELVRSEIESLGGEVAMASTVGQGARFVLTLPASAVAMPAGRARVAA